MAGIIKCPKCGKNLLVSKMIEKSGEHKGMHKATCLSHKCNYVTYTK